MDSFLTEPLVRVSREDLERIEQTARDYFEAWYTTDEQRMRRALHPDLAKRGIMRDSDPKRWALRFTDAETMAQATREGRGATPEDKRALDITVLDASPHIATVRVISYRYFEYIHLAKLEGRWVIMNTMWELRQDLLDR